MFLVVPASSKTKAIMKAYHPEDNPTGKWYWRKVGINDGFSEECLLLMDNIKVISKTRIMKKMGRLTCSLTDEDGLFREIRRSIIKNAFRGEYKKYDALLKKAQESEKKISELEEKITYLEEQNKLLTQQKDKDLDN